MAGPRARLEAWAQALGGQARAVPCDRCDGYTLSQAATGQTCADCREGRTPKPTPTPTTPGQPGPHTKGMHHGGAA